MVWFAQNILILFGLCLIIIVIAAMLAPFESLGWWAGWGGEPVSLKDLDQPKQNDVDAALTSQAGSITIPKKDLFVVYLSGIGVASADGLAKDEFDFINQLQEDLPHATIITDVFPYSVNNNPLTGERFGKPIWNKMRRIQEKNPDSLLAMATINIRNVFQVLVSSDPRYGPIYSIGVAEEIARSLAHHGYPLNLDSSAAGKPVYLIGFSGGGQVSVGAAPYLSTMINAPIYIISIGGVISDDPGIRYVQSLTHLFGEKDPIQGIGEKLWAGRWPRNTMSDWNRARAAGKIKFINMGPMAHNLLGGYYDIRVALPNQETYCAATARTVTEVITSNTSPP